MSIRIKALVLGLIFTLSCISSAQAHDSGGWKHRNHYLREKVSKLHGKRAPGCDLVAGKCKGKKINRRNVHKYFDTLRALVLPRRAVRYVRTGRPYHPPAHTASIKAGGTLEAIAQCESGSKPSTNTGNGFYGKYQFTQSTWNSVGGSGNPAAASESEQDRRAAILYAREGAHPWPVCGR